MNYYVGSSETRSGKDCFLEQKSGSPKLKAASIPEPWWCWDFIKDKIGLARAEDNEVFSLI